MEDVYKFGGEQISTMAKECEYEENAILKIGSEIFSEKITIATGAFFYSVFTRVIKE